MWGDGTGIIYTCGASSNEISCQDLVLIKWDAAGNLLWNRTLGGFGNDLGYALWGDGNGCIYSGGTTGGFSGVAAGMLLVKWDAAGSVLWARTWGSSSGSDYVNGIWGDGAGAIYTCGSTISFSESYSDLALVKWDATGNVLWNRTWGGSSGVDFASGIWGDGAGGIYTCGYTSSFGAGGSDLLLVKWDEAGNQVWNRTSGGLNEDSGNGIWGDGFYIYTVGLSCILFAIFPDMTLTKWYASGTMVWQRSLCNMKIDWACGQAIWGDGENIYACGYTGRPEGGTDMVLTRWSTDGVLLSYSMSGVASEDYGGAVWGDHAGNIYTCGSRYSTESGREMLFIKWEEPPANILIGKLLIIGATFSIWMIAFARKKTSTRTRVQPHRINETLASSSRSPRMSRCERHTSTRAID
jgi:hypothetical protein